MLSKDKHAEIIDRIRSSIGPEAGAIISEDLAVLVSDYSSVIKDVEEKNASIEELKKRNDELIDVNGKLFQRVGTETEKPADKPKEKEKEDKVLTESEILENLIDEKGEIKDE